MSEIKVLQLNLNHAKLAQDEISRKISKINIKIPTELFIFCIQEPYIFNKNMQENHRHAKSFATMKSLELQSIVIINYKTPGSLNLYPTETAQ